jgi:hypothetical protein
MSREPHEYAGYPEGHVIKDTCVKCGHAKLDAVVHPGEVPAEIAEVVTQVVMDPPPAPPEPEAIRRMKDALRLEGGA